MADWYFRNRQGGLAVCPGCRNLVRGGEEFCPYCARRLGPERGVRGWFRRLAAKPDVATRTLIAVIVLFFFLQLATDIAIPDRIRNKSDGGSAGMLFSALTANDASYILLGSNFYPYVYYFGQVWRFLTACFLHLGLLHIVFNCWALWDLGRLGERLWGAREIFAAFILTGIAGSALSFAWKFLVLFHGLHLTRIAANSLGASGAVCGIMGLLLGSYYRNKHHIGQNLGSHLVRWAVFIFAFGLAAGADNAAHLGGMAAGAAFGYFLPPRAARKNPERDQAVWNALAAAAVLLLITAMIAMAVFYATRFDDPFGAWERLRRR